MTTYRYKCELCDGKAKFELKRELEAHVRAVHGGFGKRMTKIEQRVSAMLDSRGLGEKLELAKAQHTQRMNDIESMFTGFIAGYHERMRRIEERVQAMEEAAGYRRVAEKLKDTKNPNAAAACDYADNPAVYDYKDGENEQYIVLVGAFGGGFEAHGPFATYTQAEEYASRCNMRDDSILALKMD